MGGWAGQSRLVRDLPPHKAAVFEEKNPTMLVLPQICDKGKTQSFQDCENTQLCNAPWRSPADKVTARCPPVRPPQRRGLGAGMPSCKAIRPPHGTESMPRSPCPGPVSTPGPRRPPRSCMCSRGQTPGANAGKAAPAPPPRPTPLPAWTPGRPRSQGWHSPRPSPPWRASPPPPCLQAEHSLSAPHRANGPPRTRPSGGGARSVSGDEAVGGHRRSGKRLSTHPGPSCASWPPGRPQPRPARRCPGAANRQKPLSLREGAPGWPRAARGLHPPSRPSPSAGASWMVGWACGSRRG